MSQMLNVLDLMLPKKNEYVRGTINRKNVIRLASAITGKDWPFPAIKVRRLSKPVKRGKKEYRYTVLDGVTRTFVALATLNPKVAEKVNGWLKAEGLEPMPKGVKFDKVLADVGEYTDTEADVMQLKSNLEHGQLLDKKVRDRWVAYIIKARKMNAEALAKMLHMTKRSVYRMAKGDQTKDTPRKAKGSGKPKAERAERAPEPVWTAEAYFKALRALSREFEENKSAIAVYVKGNGDGLGWLADFTASLADAIPVKG